MNHVDWNENHIHVYTIMSCLHIYKLLTTRTQEDCCGTLSIRKVFNIKYCTAVNLCIIIIAITISLLQKRKRRKISNFGRVIWKIRSNSLSVFFRFSANDFLERCTMKICILYTQCKCKCYGFWVAVNLSLLMRSSIFACILCYQYFGMSFTLHVWHAAHTH